MMSPYAGDDVAFPGPAIELHQLHLLDREEVVGRASQVLMHGRPSTIACKHVLVPYDETALLPVGNCD
jgi:hypothetical protein